MGVLVPGVVAESLEGVMALRGTVLRIRLRVNGLGTSSTLSLRGVMVSATVDSSGWGFLLYCMKNELVVVRVRVIAERIECRGEFQVGEVVGVVCVVLLEILGPERRRRAGTRRCIAIIRLFSEWTDKVKICKGLTINTFIG